jgi:hypothetical protein
MFTAWSSGALKGWSKETFAWRTWNQPFGPLAVPDIRALSVIIVHMIHISYTNI